MLMTGVIICVYKTREKSREGAVAGWEITDAVFVYSYNIGLFIVQIIHSV